MGARVESLGNVSKENLLTQTGEIAKSLATVAENSSEVQAEAKAGNGNISEEKLLTQTGEMTESLATVAENPPVQVGAKAGNGNVSMEKLLAPIRVGGKAIQSNEYSDTNSYDVVRDNESKDGIEEPSATRENHGFLHGITYRSPVASAQVKSAILLAGLYADSPTTVIEPSKSRDHTERMLRAFGAKVETSSNYGENKDNGCYSNIDDENLRTEASATVFPTESLTGQKVLVPGDISSAAYFLAAGTLIPGSEILLRNVGINPTRDGFLRVLKEMGGDFELLNPHEESGEPCSDILVRSAALKGVTVGGSLIPTLIDELPMVAVLAAFAEEKSVIKDAAELAVKESNRIKTMAEGLVAMGADIAATEDGWIINGNGGKPGLKGAAINSYNDHRIAMSFAVAALAAEGETEIWDAECVDISYPGFYEELGRLCGR
ncbi:MAG: 3-phosphoshikimate 1-carboxyvinyltransferase [Lachnospiraceae bacterium]|nr:3-phosphoshikimate 1-carboxyvinyltransferase [Lachnospiraceae bacterium]